MPRHGHATTGHGQVTEFRRADPQSSIVTYRLADYNEIFHLYLNAVEGALDHSRLARRGLTRNEVRRLLRAGAE